MTTEANSKQNGRSEALKTYIEQTKLLVTLASGFVLAPPAALSFFRLPNGTRVSWLPWKRFFLAEGLLVASILFGYVVLGTIAGSQHDEDYDVYRPATRYWSIAQLLSYLAGICIFLWMAKATL